MTSLTGGGGDEPGAGEATKKQRLEAIVLAETDDEACRTFVLHEEDHTLGNAIRYMMMKNPDVDFCGYSIPHPSENKINLRVQSRGPPATDVLRRGLSELTAASEHVLTVFENSVADFKKQQKQGSGEAMEVDTVTS